MIWIIYCIWIKIAGVLSTGYFVWIRLDYYSHDKHSIRYTVLAFAAQSLSSLSDAFCTKPMPSFCCNGHIVYELRPCRFHCFRWRQLYYSESASYRDAAEKHFLPLKSFWLYYIIFFVKRKQQSWKKNETYL